MSYLLAIAYFFTSSYLLGSSVTRFLKESEETIERHVIRLGLGLGMTVILGVLMHLLGIFLHWWAFLLLGLPLPVYDAYRRFSVEQTERSWKLKKSTVYALGAVLIAGCSLVMYLTGALSYTYLEDGDPWHHGISVHYVSKEMVLEHDYPQAFRYLDAYPPGYAIVLGMVHQISQDMVWTLKVVNALLISLGVLFFYFFVNRWFDDKALALLAMAFLAMIPSYFSHFIWSHTFAVALFFPLFYAVAKIQDDPRWWSIAAMLVGALLMIQPTTPIKGLVMLGCLGLAHTIHKRAMLKYYTAIVVIGILLSLLWWAPMMMKYGGIQDVLEGGLSQKPTTNPRWASESHVGPLGSATRLYTAKDFFVASSQNMITAPVGVGYAPMILGLLGLLLALSKGRSLGDGNWKESVLILWIIFTFLGLYGGTKLPIALFTFRFWLIFPIPLAILGAQASMYLATKVKKIGVPSFIVIGLVLASTWVSAGAIKWELNTMQWSADPGMYKYNQQDAYEFIRTLPKNTRMFDVCSREKFGDHILVSYDMETCFWCAPEREFRKQIISPTGWSVTPQKLKEFLLANHYKYLFMEGNCVETLQRRLLDNFNISDELLARNSTTTFINDVASSGLFRPVHQTQGSVIFEV